MGTLRSYLVAMLVALVAVPLVLFWAWPQSRALQDEFDEVHDRHLLIARNLSVALERYHKDVTATFNFVSDALMKGTKVDTTASLLENLRFENVCLLDLETKRVIASVDVGSPCANDFLGSRAKHFSELAHDGETVFSGVEHGSKAAPVLFVVKRNNNRLTVGTLSTGYFVALGKAISFGLKGHAAIVDQFGKILAHPRDSWIAEMHDISKVSAVKRMRNGEQGVVAFYSPALKGDVVAGFSAVPGAGWGVMVPQPVEELHANAREIELSSLMVFALGLILAAAMALLLAVMFERPLARITAAARQMADGDDEVRIKEDSRFLPVEIKEMTATINAMADRLMSARAAALEERRKADAANASKTSFLRTVTHEFRTPLNAIIGFSEILTNDQGDRLSSETRKEFARDIETGARHLLSLANDLLDLARIEAGRYEISDEIVGLDEITQRVLSLIRPEAASRNVDVCMEVEGLVPEVRGDERALFQSVLNLTSNAVRYGSAGGNVVVTLRQLESGEAEIAVSDDGAGIPPGDIERVLLPFERLAADNGPPLQGSGLGLHIVAQFTGLHGGRFRLESTVGEGTRAIIVLPAKRVVTAGKGKQRQAA